MATPKRPPKKTAKTTKARKVPAGRKSAPAKAPSTAKKPAAQDAPAARKRTSGEKAQPAAAAPAASVPRGRVKAMPRSFLLNVAQDIRDAVAPLVQQVKGREVVSTATSGDATFELDKVAEKALLNFLRREKAPVAYYSEDAGYSTFSSGQPSHLLVVDPIDGSRAARNGFEGCVVSVACTRVIERPTMADVESACVMEIMANRAFYAERGKGARIYADGTPRRPKLSQNTDLESLSWSMTVPARPAELIFPTAAALIDISSLKGGFFACNSTSFSLTRLLTNQLDACVDFASRFMVEIPDLVRDYFINAGRGNVLGICPYDLAGSLLIAQEAGCTVTNAQGQGFDEVLLLDSSENNHLSLIAAANAELHAKLMRFFDMRIQQFEKVLERNEARKRRR
jgi:myo-inositol-1(or 4)-monophosphatase